MFKYDKTALPAVFFLAMVGMEYILGPDMIISIPGLFFVVMVITSDGSAIA